MEWIRTYTTGTESNNNLIAGSSPDKTILYFYYFNIPASDTSAPDYWNHAKFVLTSDTYEIVWTDVYITGGITYLRWAGRRNGTDFCYNHFTEGESSAATHCFNGYSDATSTLYPLWSYNW